MYQINETPLLFVGSNLPLTIQIFASMRGF